MSTRLRDAAVQHLRSLGTTTEEGIVRRLTMDIEVEGRVEMVTLSVRDGELQCVSSDARNDGPHVHAALRFVAGMETREDSSPPGAVVLSAAQSDEQGAEGELAEALDDLLTAITRIGVGKAQHAPSVDAALERLIGAAPKPTPSGLGRFIGRLQNAMRSAELPRVVRLLEGASQLADALRAATPTPEAELCIGAWLGTRPGSRTGVELLSDRTMIEVGREWLSGTERASLERRYLVDAESGGVYREDRLRNATASLGPCPRQLQVGLAEVEAGHEPRRIRLLQYEVEPIVPAESWDSLRQVASHSFAEITESYRAALRASPALAEPFALIAPFRIERNGGFKAFDAEGHQLVLDRTERRGAVLAFYDLMAEGVEPSWLAGRLTDVGATVCVTPFAIGTFDGNYTRL
ncbi:MAG: hypothetical protein KJO40_16295 [Deltaproteobacteria bacterium]|nr:hypothetical protein [Deltaproteobacteria bacterium]NNK09412.1 hypothetical protein [Myxococcales bacterium]